MWFLSQRNTIYIYSKLAIAPQWKVTIIVITINPSEKLMKVLGVGDQTMTGQPKRCNLAAWSILLHGKCLTNVTSFVQNSVGKKHCSSTKHQQCCQHKLRYPNQTWLEGIISHAQKKKKRIWEFSSYILFSKGKILR